MRKLLRQPTTFVSGKQSGTQFGRVHRVQTPPKRKAKLESHHVRDAMFKEANVWKNITEDAQEWK